jgi:hypothetical protein
MFLKVHNRPAKDLKETWKWLKNNAHLTQSLLALASTIDIVMSEYTDKSYHNCQNMSFMEGESYRVLNKVQKIISASTPQPL